MIKNLKRRKTIILIICCFMIFVSVSVIKNKKVEEGTTESIENLLQEFFSLEFSKEPVDCSNLVKNDMINKLYNKKLTSLVEFNNKNDLNDFNVKVNISDINKARNNTFDIKFTLDKVFYILGKESSEENTEYLATIKKIDDNFYIEKITDTKSYKEFLQSKNKGLKSSSLDDKIYEDFIKQELRLR